MPQELGSVNEFAASKQVSVAKDTNGFGTGIVYRGGWDPTTGNNYFVNDIVSFWGQSYLCLVSNPGGVSGILPNNPQYWRPLPPDGAMAMAATNDFGDPARGLDDFANPPRVASGF